MTIAAWVKYHVIDHPRTGNIMVNGNINGQSYYDIVTYGLYTNTFGQGMYFCARLDGAFQCDNAYGSPINKDDWDLDWHYVVGTYDGQEVELWIDGIKQRGNKNVSGAITPVESSKLVIGRSLDGNVDEVTIWNRALNYDEIQALYQEMK